MDLAAGCKDKLQHFRVRDLKDVLTHLGLTKQGKKQDLVDRILAVLVDDEVAKIMARRPTLSKEGVAKLVEDIYRKMKGRGATDLASSIHDSSDTSQTIALKPKEEVDDSFNREMKVRCPCGSSLLTESMIRCEDPSCKVWQHISCVIIPQNPLDGIPPVPSQFYCEICRLARADPFWSIVAHPLLPVKLMTTSLPADGTNPVQALDKTFHLTRTDRESLSKPEYAVQAWCMLFNDNVPFRMQWLQSADLQVNGFPVRAVSRPGFQLLGANGRDDGPNISQFTRDGINKISLTGCDARIFCFGVRLVKRRTLQQILSHIPKESDGERFEDALVRVIRCIGGGAAEDADSDSDLEVVADSFILNLRCPMSGSRMKTAGRFRPCVHMGCFDLETFVEMQQSSRKWQCPVCLKNYSLEHLIVDPYFNRITSMMNSCGEDATEIEVKPDGSWRCKGDCDRRDLKQWHQPDGSICFPSEGESKHNTEGSIPVKLESGSLKIGTRKNSNGVWEVSKHGDDNTISSSERVPENFGSGGLGVIPCSSATGSGRAGKDASVNQDGNRNFDLAESNSVKLDSISLNFEPSYEFAAQNANVIVLSDSDEENDMIANGTGHNSGLIDSVYNYDIGPHGNSGSYQDEPGLGIAGSSYLDNFNQANDDFGLTMWQLSSTMPTVSSLQLFGSHGDGSNTLGNANLINGFMLDPGNSIDHPNNDLNDVLVNNPLRLGGEDPSLQIFLPARPSKSEHTQVRNLPDVRNGFGNDDWISLRLGDGAGSTHGDSRDTNGMTSGHQSHHTERAMGSVAETVHFAPSSNVNKSEKTKHSSGSPFSYPLQQDRSVRPRLHISTDSNS